MKRVITVILSILMLGAFLTACMNEEKIEEAIATVERYQYPIDITSEDWFEYSVVEKSAMLRIPQETLDGMSDLELLFAAADYPYFVDASIYGFDKDGFATYAKYCSAFEELLSRKSFVKSLQTYGEAIIREYLSDLSNTMAVARADFMLNVMEVYTGSRPDISDLKKALAQIATETTAPQQNQATETTTATPEPTESPALSIPWMKEQLLSPVYTYEDYIAFERFFSAERLAASEDLYVQKEDGFEKYRPFVEDGKIYLRKTDDTVCFQVGEETYEDLDLFGTDGYYWIYCAEAGKILFRIDPLGNKETLFEDETGCIGSGSSWIMGTRVDEGFRLEDRNQIAIFTAGTPEGYGIYRLHLQSKHVDLLVSEEQVIHLGDPESSFKMRWRVGDEETLYESPGQQWDLSDPDVQRFQKLLDPSRYGILNGVNNWYNDAVGVFFENPSQISLNALMDNGFRDLSTKLTQTELSALGETADAKKDYYKLPGERIDQVLMTLYGITRADLDRDTLLDGETMMGEPILYDPDVDTYYKPCTLKYEYGNPVGIYIWDTGLTVHKVERKDDGTIWIYYLPSYPSPYSSSTGSEENLMVLKQTSSGYRILRNGRAVQPTEVE